MPHRTVELQTFRKHGCILTCYVNGKKRFRALTGVKPPTRTRNADGSTPRLSDEHSDRPSIVGL